jgi:molybdate transport system ATP-binding protein
MTLADAQNVSQQAEIVDRLRAQPHHQLRVKGDRGAVQLDIDTEFAAPWTVIFGPSGSGKSSLLRAACGLVPQLDVEFRRWDKSEWLEVQGPSRSMPTAWREIAYAPQGTAIFPHLSVRENIEFGLRSRGVKDTADYVGAAIDTFSLGPLLKRMPRELSGGERQGVSLARAFAVPHAKLMLLDEPFNGIGRSMRDALLPRMRERLAQLGVPAISVTHDVEEAILLEADVLRLDAGKSIARGSALHVLDEERRHMRKALDL